MKFNNMDGKQLNNVYKFLKSNCVEIMTLEEIEEEKFRQGMAKEEKLHSYNGNIIRVNIAFKHKEKYDIDIRSIK